MGLVGTFLLGLVDTVPTNPYVNIEGFHLILKQNINLYRYAAYRPIHSIMRNYKKKSQKGQTPPDIMLRAVRAVKRDGHSLRETSRDFGIPVMTLRRYCQKFSFDEINAPGVNVPTTVVGYIAVRQVKM